jgi:hypothetical protein
MAAMTLSRRFNTEIIATELSAPQDMLYITFLSTS